MYPKALKVLKKVLNEQVRGHEEFIEKIDFDTRWRAVETEMGLDSLDLVELVMVLEDEFETEIDDGTYNDWSIGEVTVFKVLEDITEHADRDWRNPRVD